MPIDLQKEYKLATTAKGKRYYILTRKLWRIIEGHKKSEDSRKTVKDLSDISSLPKRQIYEWLHGIRKPIVVDNLIVTENNSGNCPHGFTYFCPICNMDNNIIRECPVPLFWVSAPKGKLYVYDKYWKELEYFIDNINKFGLLLSNLYSKVNIDDRQIRSWQAKKCLPKIFSEDEFSFSEHNLYFLGLYLSDGHIRNNGSRCSFVYQSGSANIFQGYWYPQLIQRFLPIFLNKQSKSNTYLITDKSHGKLVFSTNLSSLSPIFALKAQGFGLMGPRNNSSVTGYAKSIPDEFLCSVEDYGEFFQGVYDGDGHYATHPSPLFDLATSQDIDYSFFVKRLGLVPTLTSHDKKRFIDYSQRVNESLYLIRLAPGSLNRMSEEHKVTDIVNQLNFMVDSASNSIRPDKVHQLASIIMTITDENYGNSKNANPLQKEIRELARKSSLRLKAAMLKIRYPVKNGKYLPFMPKWAENLCLKNDAWNFFFKKENLVFRQDCKYKDLDFSKGIPIDVNA